jgi:magnesium transporter
MEVLTAVDRARIAELEARDEFFWLDLREPSEQDLETLADLLGLHPAAIEDTLEWDQIPKLDDYGETFMLVFFTARRAPGPDRYVEPVEVHIYISGSFVLTFRRCETPLDRLHDWLRNSQEETEDEVLYHILDALADGWDPVIDLLDQLVDGVEGEVLARPQQRHLRDIYRLKQDVGELAHYAVPQPEVVQAAIDTAHENPEISRGSREWLRDVVTHVSAIAGDLDRLAADLRALTDTFFNANANRLNRLATLLAVGGTFFLVWTLVTSFFGQNFKWLVDHVASREDFLLLGVGGLLVPTLLLAIGFWWRRDDWW